MSTESCRDATVCMFDACTPEDRPGFKRAFKQGEIRRGFKPPFNRYPLQHRFTHWGVLFISPAGAEQGQAALGTCRMFASSAQVDEATRCVQLRGGGAPRPRRLHRGRHRGRLRARRPPAPILLFRTKHPGSPPPAPVRFLAVPPPRPRGRAKLSFASRIKRGLGSNTANQMMVSLSCAL